jgi:hypothetical protein
MTDPRKERWQSPSLAADTTDATVEAVSPSRNAGVTMARATCEVCGRAFRPAGRRRFCSDACRQAAWRRRHSTPPRLPALPDAALRPARSATVYECPSCGTRYLGAQRCPDCGLFCRRVGPGGRCPHCDEPVAVADLIAGGEG